MIQGLSLPDRKNPSFVGGSTEFLRETWFPDFCADVTVVCEPCFTPSSMICGDSPYDKSVTSECKVEFKRRTTYWVEMESSKVDILMSD
jgi:hypothetical protein